MRFRNPEKKQAPKRFTIPKQYEEIARFKNNVEDMTNSSDIKKLREENRRMKIELTAIKNVIKRYMVTAPPPKTEQKGRNIHG